MEDDMMKKKPSETAVDSKKKTTPDKRGRGRPKTLAADLTERFQIRCSPADIEAWKAAAATAGHASVGAWIRKAANTALKRAA
jgi:hypothetical protein